MALLHHARGAGSGQARWHASALAHLLCSCSRSSATIISSSGSSQSQQQQWGDGEPQAEETSRQFSHFGSSSSSSSQQHGGAWAQQHSSKRAVSTSPAASYDSFARVLKQPVPKSAVLNRSTYKAWTRSRLDVGFAEQLLQLRLQKGEPSVKEAQQSAHRLLLEARSLPDLERFVQHLGPYVGPGLLAVAAAHAANLLKATATTPALAPEQAWPVLATAIQQLEPQLCQLTLPGLSSLMYAVSRARYPLPSPTREALLKELPLRAAALLHEGTSPAVPGSIMLSLVSLGMCSPGCEAWRAVCAAVAARVDGLEAAQAKQVVKALCKSGDQGSELWGPVEAVLRMRMGAWAQAAPEDAAAITSHLAAADGHPRVFEQVAPSAIRAFSSQRSSSAAALAALSPHALAHLAHTAAAAATQVKEEGVQGRAVRLLDQACLVASDQLLRLPTSVLQSLLASLAAAGRLGSPLIRLCAEILRVRGAAATGEHAAAHMLCSLAALGYEGQELCRQLLPQLRDALPRLRPSAALAARDAFARMARPEDAQELMARLEAGAGASATAAPQRSSPQPAL